MMDATLKPTLERFQALQTERASWEARWRDIARYVAPTRDDFLNDETARNRPIDEPRLFDATASMACETLAAGIYGLITPWL